MLKMKNRIVPAVLAAMALTALTACGGDKRHRLKKPQKRKPKRAKKKPQKRPIAKLPVTAVIIWPR